jgi:AbiA family abortive infection protein
MPTYPPSQLGHFIDEKLWQQAIKLLDFQIAQKARNKHFNTLTMNYYERITDLDKVRDPAYFHIKVANNLFYGLSGEFSIHDYLIPKPGLGLRNYKFFSYPLRATYYAIGLYLLKLSQEYLDEYRPRYPHIKSYYGGQLRLQKDELSLNSKSVFYRKHYKEFRANVRKQLQGDIQNRVVIKLDIKDYFDEISIPTLLDLLRKHVKAGIVTDLLYTTETIEQIAFFFRYMMTGRQGIPQADNDVVSGFIAYLYLVFADYAINYEINRDRDMILDHTIIRYVDDIYISINFKDAVAQRTREDYVDALGSRIADVLFFRLGLKLNTKSRLFWLFDDEDVDALRKNLRKVSTNYYVDDNEDETVDNKVATIFVTLERLKRSKLGADFVRESSLEDEILKEIFDPSVDQILNRPDNIARIRDIFDEFNFDHVKASPFEIIIILMKDDHTKQKFKQFLLDKKYLPTDDVDLILKYLAQTEFNDIDLISKLKKNTYMLDIAQILLNSPSTSHNPGYYGLDETKLQIIANHLHVIDQVRLRSINERTMSYSVALNHLLNEIHAICHVLDKDTTKLPKDYEAKDVVSFLMKQNVPHEVCNGIRNLFDRRNRNQVSHPGSEKTISWSVTRQEYEEYYTHVEACMSLII